jgi:hypothetical protein
MDNLDAQKEDLKLQLNKLSFRVDKIVAALKSADALTAESNRQVI